MSLAVLTSIYTYVTQAYAMTSPLTVARVHVVGGLDVDEAGCVPLTHDGPEALVLRVDGQRARVLAEVLCKLIDHTSFSTV